MQIPNQPIGNIDANIDPNNGSFENYFDTGSNNDENYLVNAVHQGLMGSMINMQDIKNVRESYSKKLEEDSESNHERRMDMMMMIEMAHEG